VVHNDQWRAMSPDDSQPAEQRDTTREKRSSLTLKVPADGTAIAGFVEDVVTIQRLSRSVEVSYRGPRVISATSAGCIGHDYHQRRRGRASPDSRDRVEGARDGSAGSAAAPVTPVSPIVPLRGDLIPLSVLRSLSALALVCLGASSPRHLAGVTLNRHASNSTRSTTSLTPSSYQNLWQLVWQLAH
jgi:hypothetical protein